jgi:hypothetical protein
MGGMPKHFAFPLPEADLVHAHFAEGRGIALAFNGSVNFLCGDD